MRRDICSMALAAALILGGYSTLTRAADEKPADKPAPAAKKDAKPKTVRLVKPWSGISSLTDEQKTKIADLHKKSLEEKKAVEKKENDAIMEVLTDAQKAELKAMDEKEAADKKMKKPAEGAAAPKPAEK